MVSLQLCTPGTTSELLVCCYYYYDGMRLGVCFIAGLRVSVWAAAALAVAQAPRLFSGHLEYELLL